MNGIESLFTRLRNHRESRTISRYLVIGTVNTVLGYLFFFGMVTFKVNYQVALMLVTGFVILHGFYWHKHWTFSSKSNTLLEFLRFNSVYFTTYFLNMFLLYVFVEILLLDARVGQVICIVITTILNFIGHRLWSFMHA